MERAGFIEAPVTGPANMASKSTTLPMPDVEIILAKAFGSLVTGAKQCLFAFDLY